jgi:hypothetical protein
MPNCKILVDYPNAEGWSKGEVVDITNPARLIEEGKVELYVSKKSLPSNSDKPVSKARRSTSSKKKS